MSIHESTENRNSNGTGPSHSRVDDMFNDGSTMTDDELRQEQRRFKPYRLIDLRNRPCKQYLIGQIVGIGDLVIVVGPSGEGKTFTVIDMIFSGCTGTQFAKRFDVSRPINIAYCAGEGVGGLAQRFEAAAQRYGVDDLPNLTIFEIAPQLFYKETDTGGPDGISNFVLEWAEAQAAGERQPLDLLIIDTLHSAIIGAEENSAKDMGRVLQLCKMATAHLGCGVMLVHHTGKNGDYRGSTALLGSADAMVEVKKVGGKFMMSCRKLKDSEVWTDQTFDLISKGDSVYVDWDEPRETKSATKQDRDVEAIVAALGKVYPNKLPARGVSEAIGLEPSSRQVYELLKRAEGAGRVRKGLQDPSKPYSARANSWVYGLVFPPSSAGNSDNGTGDEPATEG